MNDTDQLTNVLYEATDPDTPPSAWTNEARYAFDAAGNRSSVELTNSSTNSYTANALNQYTAVGGASPSYDSNGNLNYDGSVWIFSYDRENRLTGASQPGDISLNYHYDAFNRLIQRSSVEVGTRQFYYDEQWRVIAEYEGGNLLAKYVYGPEIDEPVRMTRDSTDYYYHAAALGTVTEITDAAGDLVEAYRYDVYGEPTIYDSTLNPQPSTAIGNRLLFQARDRDPATGLYNFRYRYYSPGLGRFVQVDPLIYDHASAEILEERQDLNFYNFAANSPTCMVDPFGETPAAGVGLVAAATALYNCIKGAVISAFTDATVQVAQQCYAQVGWQLWKCDLGKCKIDPCSVAVSAAIGCAAGVVFPIGSVFTLSGLKLALQKFGAGTAAKLLGKLPCK